MKSSKFQIFSFFGTQWFISSLLIFRNMFFLTDSSLGGAGRRYTSVSASCFLFSCSLASTYLPSFSVGKQTNFVRILIRFLSNFPSRFSSVIWILTPISFNNFLTSSVVGTRFSDIIS